MSGREGQRTWTQASPGGHALHHYLRTWPDSAPLQVTGSRSCSSGSSGSSPFRPHTKPQNTGLSLCCFWWRKTVSSLMLVSTANRGILCVIYSTRHYRVPFKALRVTEQKRQCPCLQEVYLLVREKVSSSCLSLVQDNASRGGKHKDPGERRERRAPKAQEGRDCWRFPGEVSLHFGCIWETSGGF